MTVNGEVGITLKEIIDAGVLKVNSQIYPSSNNKEVVGTLLQDGSIVFELNGRQKSYPFPSGAARAVEGRSLNGWKYWRIKDNNGELRELSYYRDLFLAQK